MNFNALILVIDSARARSFRIEPTSSPRAPVALRELESLVHPEARVKEGERHAGSFPAGVHTGKGGSGHTLDDHRGAHESEERHRFARQAAQAVARTVKEASCNPVIVMATHPMHAVLRAELERELPREVYVRYEIGEFSELSPSELLEELQQRRVFEP
ncbi:MAG TPA: host attachment protein [Polyangiaceae bacterium]|jgi:protein required for attachment to host cells|nr:host attachment protein [Polyangiaceae bacterium]